MIMSKRIVLCFDGTNNQFGESNTNIAKLCQLLEQEKADEQIIFYDPGVGSKNFDEEHAGFFSKLHHTIKERALGYGLQKNIEDGLRFLMEHYIPDDKVFLFGFSRGAFTARSLAGMLKRTGLLRKGKTNLIKTQTKIYNECGDASKNVIAQDFKATFGRECPVHFIGVWDTVSTLYGLARKRFHDCKLSDGIPYGYHALALNEDRVLFAPEQWDFPNGPTENKKQVWFAGCHSDVAGGYADSGLGDITLQWMLDYARAPGGEDNNATGVLVREERVQKVLVKEGYKSIYNIKPDPLAKLHSEDNKWLKEAISAGAILATGILAVAILGVAMLGIQILEAAMLGVSIISQTTLKIIILGVAILGIAILGTILGAILALAIHVATILVGVVSVAEILGVARLGGAILETARSGDARSRKKIVVGIILAVTIGVVAILGTEILEAILRTILATAIVILVGAIFKTTRLRAIILATTSLRTATRSRAAKLEVVLGTILKATRLRAAKLAAKRLRVAKLGAILGTILATAIGAAILGAILGEKLEVAILDVAIEEVTILKAEILGVLESGIVVLGVAILGVAILAAILGAILGAILVLAIHVVAILATTRTRAVIGAILEVVLGVARSRAVILGAILATAISGVILGVAMSKVAIPEITTPDAAILELAISGVAISGVAILGAAIVVAAILILFISLNGKRKIVASNPEAKPLIHESVQTRMNEDEDYEKQMNALLKANDLQLSDIEFVKK